MAVGIVERLVEMAATEAVVVEAAALAVELVVPPEGARATETADMSVRAMEAVR